MIQTKKLENSEWLALDTNSQKSEVISYLKNYQRLGIAQKGVDESANAISMLQQKQQIFDLHHQYLGHDLIHLKHAG